MRYLPGMEDVRKYVKLLWMMCRVPMKFVVNWLMTSCSDWSSAAAMTPVFVTTVSRCEDLKGGDGTIYHSRYNCVPVREAVREQDSRDMPTSQ